MSTEYVQIDEYDDECNEYNDVHSDVRSNESIEEWSRKPFSNPMGESFDESFGELVIEPVGESFGEPVSESFGESFDEPVTEPVGESFDEPVAEPVGAWTSNTLIGTPLSVDFTNKEDWNNLQNEDSCEKNFIDTTNVTHWIVEIDDDTKIVRFNDQRYVGYTHKWRCGNTRQINEKSQSIVKSMHVDVYGDSHDIKVTPIEATINIDLESIGIIDELGYICNEIEIVDDDHSNEIHTHDQINPSINNTNLPKMFTDSLEWNRVKRGIDNINTKKIGITQFTELLDQLSDIVYGFREFIPNFMSHLGNKDRDNFYGGPIEHYKLNRDMHKDIYYNKYNGNIYVNNVTNREYDVFSRNPLKELEKILSIKKDIDIPASIIESYFTNAQDALTCVSNYIDSLNKQSFIPNAEKIKHFIINRYELTDQYEDRIKFKDLLDVVCSKFNVVDNKHIRTVKHKLPHVLKELGLNKQRYAKGMYWYGLVNKHQIGSRLVEKAGGSIPLALEMLEEEREKTQQVFVENDYDSKRREIAQQYQYMKNINDNINGSMMNINEMNGMMNGMGNEMMNRMMNGMGGGMGNENEMMNRMMNGMGNGNLIQQYHNWMNENGMNVNGTNVDEMMNKQPNESSKFNSIDNTITGYVPYTGKYNSLNPLHVNNGKN